MKMKFCQKFGISPIEFDKIPLSTIEEWILMSNLEAQLKGKDGA